jgi:hypothetical protein
MVYFLEFFFTKSTDRPVCQPYSVQNVIVVLHGNRFTTSSPPDTPTASDDHRPAQSCCRKATPGGCWTTRRCQTAGVDFENQFRPEFTDKLTQYQVHKCIHIFWFCAINSINFVPNCQMMFSLCLSCFFPRLLLDT